MAPEVADDAWKRLGEEYAGARERRRLTQAQAHEALGISRTTLQKIEAGRVYTKVQHVHRAYARLVGWTEESPELVLAGGDPVLVDPDEPSDEEPPPSARVKDVLTDPEAAQATGLDDLSLVVVDALNADGRIVNDQVWTVPIAGTTARAALVVRLDPNASPEEQRAVAEAWREREEAIRRALEGAPTNTDE